MKRNTFVVVTWNNATTIESLIQSIRKYEIDSKLIIIDNDSSDNTINIVKQYKWVKLISLKDNLGFAKANNIASKQVDTEYVTFLNPDTQLEDSVISCLIKKMRKSHAGLIGVKLVNKDGSLQPSIFKFQTPFEIILEQFRIGKILPERLKTKFSPEQSKHNKELSVDWLVGAFLFTKLSYYKAVGGFSEDYFLYAEDMDLCYKYHLHNLSVLFDPKISIKHIGGVSERETNSSKSLKLLNSFCIFSNKYNLNKNIKTFYYCYYIKKLLFFFDKKKVSKYKKNIEFLKGKIK